MKIAARAAPGFCRSPDPQMLGALLSGADAGLISDQRLTLTKAILGPEPDDLRIDRMDAAEARRDSAMIADALRARGFFPGRRLILIDGGTDGLAKPLEAALEGATTEDAFLIVTADTLPAKSALRKLFEKHGGLAYVPFFADGLSLEAILDMVAASGLGRDISRNAQEALLSVASGMDHGSFRQFLSVLSLYVSGRESPLSDEDVMALAPAEMDADTDVFIRAVAQGQASDIGPLLRRISAGGSTAVGLLLAMQRHFRMLFSLSASGAPERAVERARPPLFGRRRDDVLNQLRRWRPEQLETANRALFEADRKVRSSSRAPDFPVVERVALRLAIMARR